MPKRKRYTLTKRESFIVGARQKWRCKICWDMLTDCIDTDHIVALCNGGTNDISNFQLLCLVCHRRKTYNDNQKKRAREIYKLLEIVETGEDNMHGRIYLCKIDGKKENIWVTEESIRNTRVFNEFISTY